jgi:hypothetical protein
MMVPMWVLVHPRLNSKWLFTVVYISVGLLLKKKISYQLEFKSRLFIINMSGLRLVKIQIKTMHV